MAETIDIQPLSNIVGAVVDGVDLTRPVDDATGDLLRNTFYENSILCIRDQQLAATDQIQFADLFGPVDSGFRVRSGYGGDETRQWGVMLVSNIRRNGVPIGSLPDGEMQFHSDGAHRDVPYAATTLYAIKLPSRAGIHCLPIWPRLMTHWTRKRRNGLTPFRSAIFTVTTILSAKKRRTNPNPIPLPLRMGW